jgi:putative endonuclease
MPAEKLFSIYILASRKNGTLYTGHTSNLARRLYEHKNNLIEGFTKKYGVHTLVYYETCNDAEGAILREKTIKHWPRKKKLQAIEQNNPDWRNLESDLA